MIGKLSKKFDTALNISSKILDRACGSFDNRSVEVLIDDEVEKHIKRNKKIILYVGLKYDYGNKRWGLSYEHYNFYHTLLNMDYSLIYFDYDRIKHKYGRKKMSQMLREIIYYYQPDILFYMHGYDWIGHDVLREIANELPTITIIWLGDDNTLYEQTRPVWELFNFIITADRSGYEKRRKEGFNNVFLRQFACNHYLYKNLNLSKIYDVSFVGRCFGERQKFVAELRKNGVKVEAFGQGWPGQTNNRLSQADLIKIYNQSKISLNLSLLHSYAYAVKGRDFEAPGCGSLLLTRDADEIKKYFVPGKEIITYKDENDAMEKIKYYLINENEREKIARNGYERILKDHTWEKRLSEIFNLAQSIKVK